MSINIVTDGELGKLARKLHEVFTRVKTVDSRLNRFFMPSKKSLSAMDPFFRKTVLKVLTVFGKLLKLVELSVELW
jgi:hypothetical protein